MTERLDDLEYEGLMLYQDPEGACFSADAVLLVNFLRVHKRDTVVDLGSASGILSILGQAKYGARFTGVELQPQLVALARRSAEKNGQDIPFFAMDVSDAPKLLGHGTFTAAVMNPPYFTSGDKSGKPARAAARHAEAGLTERFLASAFLLLKNGGRLFCTCPAERLSEILCALHEARLEPKRLLLVSPNAEKPPYLALIEAKKLGRPGLIVEKPLILSSP